MTRRVLALIRFLQRVLIALVFAIMADGIVHSAASAQSHTPTLRVEVDLQSLDVQVKGRRGNDALGLTAKDFTVLENGKPQKIAFFDAGNGPVSLAVLVDSSDSVSSSGNLGSAEAVATQFMHLAHPSDEIWAMDFTDQVGPFEQIRADQLVNPSAFQLTAAPSHGSALYDAIATALCRLRASKNPRQAVIVVTDGVDEYSRITLDQLIGLVRSSRAQLFMIGLQSRPYFHLGDRVGPTVTLITGHDIDNPVVVFDRLMKESGAESFIPNSERSLQESLKAVSNILQSEYTLAYYPRKTGKQLRKIEVKVDRRGLRVLSRHFVGSYESAVELIQFQKGVCTVSPEMHPYPYESRLMHGPSGLVYREDFSDARSGWPNRKNSHYLPGGYELSNLEVSVSQSHKWLLSGSLEETTTTTFQPDVLAAYGPWWNNFRASVTFNAVLQKVSHNASVTLLHNSQPAAGLLFRMTPDGYYALLISSAKNKKEVSAELVRRDIEGMSYTQTVLVPWVAVAQPPALVIEITLEDIGNKISVSLNGQKVMTAQDDRFDRGLVGFVISGPGHAIFRDLVVQQE